MTDSDRPVLLLTCSGISHTGKLTTLAGHSLHCRYPLLVARHLKLAALRRPLEEELGEDECLIAVDGCEECCVKKRIDLIGRVPDMHLIATHEGITKRGLEEPRHVEIEGLSQVIMRSIRNERRMNKERDI
ncbi:MAG TPA: putative zinc-binding protein [Methanolinea sp.]|nr:putative zinc-binding protein [Methanolinea sp.]HQK55140.1 putative zinc-binding protein [Methanolinea sp.]